MTLSLLDAVQATLTDDVLVSNNELECLIPAECDGCQREKVAKARRRREAIMAALSPLLLDAEAQRQRVEEALKTIAAITRGAPEMRAVHKMACTHLPTSATCKNCGAATDSEFCSERCHMEAVHDSKVPEF